MKTRKRPAASRHIDLYAIESPKPGVVVDDPAGEWRGMPEFSHRDLTAVQKVIVHFKSRDDVQAFAERVGQPITDRTKSLWFPKQKAIGYGTCE